jgi:hypothetical protein
MVAVKTQTASNTHGADAMAKWSEGGKYPNDLAFLTRYSANFVAARADRTQESNQPSSGYFMVLAMPGSCLRASGWWFNECIGGLCEHVNKD